MRVLLPPSQGKSAPAEGPPVELDALTFPELSPMRERLVRALDPGLLTAPAGAAGEVYTGVLFERLRLPELPAKARQRVLIASALWGVVGPGDRIPAYKLDMSSKPEGIGGLAAFWRPALAEALPDEGLIVDMRSGAYAAAWRAKRATVVTVRGFREQPDGSRQAITHMVKRVRGDVARVLLEADEPPESPAEVLSLVERAGLRAELDPAQGSLDVIEAAG